VFYRHFTRTKDRIGTHRKLWNGKHYDKHFLRSKDRPVVDYPSVYSLVRRPTSALDLFRPRTVQLYMF